LYLAQLGRLDENKLQKTLGRSSALPYETATNDLFREKPLESRCVEDSTQTKMHPKKHEKKQLLCTENASLCATCPLAKKTAFVIWKPSLLRERRAVGLRHKRRRSLLLASSTSRGAFEKTGCQAGPEYRQLPRLASLLLRAVTDHME
jgi:hypothetical protein